MLDWELCTAGDPLADVGQMVAYWNELRAPADAGFFREPVAALDGFPDADALAGGMPRPPAATSPSSATGSRSRTGRSRSSSRASTAAG